MSHTHGPNCNHDAPPQTVAVSDANKAPPLLRSTAEYLMDAKKSGLKARQGVFNGKRVEYFKGRGPPLTEREQAHAVMNDLGRHGFILHVDRGDSISGKGSPKVLQPNAVQEIKEDSYYMWIWEGSQLKLYVGAACLVATILAAVLFPLWPDSLRMGVWYLSVGVLGLLGVFFGIAAVRLVLYVVSIIILPRGFWLFPNLFADCGVIESFAPFWGWDEPKQVKKSVEAEVPQTTTDTKTD
ncbi:translocation protein Sec62-domain-containing protein [Phycomyces nitens]|nr:translocation protein Sec62-domain-containing protein [Phycomyces nitens]